VILKDHVTLTTGVMMLKNSLLYSIFTCVILFQNITVNTIFDQIYAALVSRRYLISKT